MRQPSDQTHFIHAIGHLAEARRELWESMKDGENSSSEPIIESIDNSIRRIASFIR